MATQNLHQRPDLHDLRIPRHDGAVLAIPPLGEWNEWLGELHTELPLRQGSIGGLGLPAFRELARREALQLAGEYLSQFNQDLPATHESSPTADLTTARWVVSGHQPELYHPGVWIKNFALTAPANAVTLNVLIDNDTIKATAIRVPTGEPDALLLAHVPFDQWTSEIPYEEANAADEDLFASFADRVLEKMTPLSKDSSDQPMQPMIHQYWDRVLAARAVTSNLGERFAAGRRDIERTLGVANREVPLSWLCRSEGFCRLAAQLLVDAPRFRSIHNQLLADYRSEHGIKSKNHPVADLAERNGAVDTPLWVWSSDEPERQRLFVRRTGNALALFAGSRALFEIAVDPADEIGSTTRALRRQLDQTEWKIRPRALLTTIFLRLGLADLFVHGIGGGIYDALTDQIIEAYFGIAAPPFAILSCTVHLGIETGPGEMTSREVDQLLRDMEWNPDRHIDEMLLEQSPISGLIEEKLALIESEPATRTERRQRYRRFREINASLREYLGARQQVLRRERSTLRHQEENAAIATRRDYPFCLYPLRKLASFFEQVTSTKFAEQK